MSDNDMDSPTEDEMESFNNDLATLFEKHHIAVLWEPDHLVRLHPNSHVDYIGMYMDEFGKKWIVPICSKVDLNNLVHLENDNDELSES